MQTPRETGGAAAGGDSEPPERSLHRVPSTLSMYQTTPISKHYALNNQILSVFESNYENKVYSVAYALGKRFVETALLEIPKHGYFYSPRHESERVHSSLEAIRVTSILQKIQESDGNYDMAERRKIQKLSKLAKEQARQGANSLSYEIDRATLEAELKGESDPFSDLCGPLMIFDSICPPRKVSPKRDPTQSSIPKLQRSFTDETYRIPQTTRAPLPRMTSRQQSDSSSSTIPPPPPLENNFGIHYYQTPSLDYNASDLDLKRALFLSGLEYKPPPAETEEQSQPLQLSESKSMTSKIAMSTLCELYREDFESLLSSGRVQISRMDTYQGRVAGSTNGCAVIAPMLCIHHFVSCDTIPDPGLPDFTIQQVMDDETPSILPEVRKSLGLTQDAFIIPSDALDHLISRELLSQDQFVTVCGGNILDEGHVNNLVQTLETSDAPGKQFQGKKLACTLFFHEHVVALQKLRQSKTGQTWHAWYDIIDSLPLQETLLLNKDGDNTNDHHHHSNNNNNTIHSHGNSHHNHMINAPSAIRSEEKREGPPALLGTIASIPDSYHQPSTQQSFDNDSMEEDGFPPASAFVDDFVPNAARIRCFDIEAFKATLRWYACSKFTKENLAYIDRYPWDAMNTDFDPRVFQAFVWAEA